MALNINKAVICGRRTRDPETKETSNGGKITTFGVATNRYGGKDAEGKRLEITDFHNVTVFNQGLRVLADLCAQYLHKGSQVYLEGRIETRSWDDQTTGQKRSSTSIVATDVQFMEPKGSGSKNGVAAAPVAAAPVPAPVPVAAAVDEDAEDLPF